MDKVDDFIHSVLQHAPAPRIYDPVKAHEYYLRTRELKGKRSASALKTKAQKEGFTYVKAVLGETKKADLKKLSEENKAKMQKIRDDVAAKRKELSLKIKALGKDASKAEREKLASELKTTLEKTRTEFKAAIEGIKAKYESDLTSEFNALKSMKTKRR
jgi:hypothetical protein